MTLSQEKKFRAKTPYIKKVSYNVVMYSPKMAEDSVKYVKKVFLNADNKERIQLIKMMQMAGSIATANSKDAKHYNRKQREKFHEVAIMYKALRRDLENIILREQNG